MPDSEAEVLIESVRDGVICAWIIAAGCGLVAVALVGAGEPMLPGLCSACSGVPDVDCASTVTACGSEADTCTCSGAVAVGDCAALAVASVCAALAVASV